MNVLDHKAQTQEKTWLKHCKKQKEQSIGKKTGIKMLREQRSEAWIILPSKEAFFTGVGLTFRKQRSYCHGNKQ